MVSVDEDVIFVGRAQIVMKLLTSLIEAISSDDDALICIITSLPSADRPARARVQRFIVAGMLTCAISSSWWLVSTQKQRWSKFKFASTFCALCNQIK